MRVTFDNTAYAGGRPFFGGFALWPNYKQFCLYLGFWMITFDWSEK